MKHRNASGEDEETAIDISPLIDCVFILLIFFIVTTRFIEEKGFEVDKPQPTANPTNSNTESDTVVLTVTEKGKVTYEGNEITLTAIQSLVERKVRVKEETPVIVQAQGKAGSGILVKVIDAAKLGGATVVSLATVK
jgi:biopolymer transport protein ExbD